MRCAASGPRSAPGILYARVLSIGAGCIMKIVHVVNVRWFNATAWYGVWLAGLMRAAGHDCLVLGLEATEPLLRAQALGLPCQALELNTRTPQGIVRLYFRLKRLLRDFAPDIVNCHRGEAFVLWGLLRRQARTFRLIRTRGDRRMPRANLANRWLHADVADAVIVTTRDAEGYCREGLGVPAARVHCIPGGVDTRAFRFDAAGRERVRHEFGFGAESRVIGLLGRFDRVKGQRELIAALAALRERRAVDDVRLLLIGYDTALRRQEIEAWVRDYGLDARCAITGRRDDVAACISALDIGVVASLGSEAIARAALEIMACGRPLVSTAVGVMPDLLSAEALVPPGDVQSLSARLERVLDDAGFASRLLSEQQKRIAGLTAEHFLEQTLAVYQDCLQRA